MNFELQVLVEKLLRSCPGIKKIYVLLRSKKGLDPRQRLEELLDCEVSHIQTFQTTMSGVFLTFCKSIIHVTL